MLLRNNYTTSLNLPLLFQHYSQCFGAPIIPKNYASIICQCLVRGEERWQTREEGGVKEVGMDTLGRDEDWKE